MSSLRYRSLFALLYLPAASAQLPPTCEALRQSDPTLPSGAYPLRPRGTHADSEVVEAFCEFGTSPAGQSIFDVPSGRMALVGDTLCTLTHNNDDMDSTLMWATLDGKVKSTNNGDTTSSDWYTFSRDDMVAAPPGSQGNLWGSDANFYRPLGIGNNDKPIPFPRSGVAGGTVVWLSSAELRFRMAGADYTLPYPSTLPYECTRHLNTSLGRVDLYGGGSVYVTDGISSVAIGWRDGTALTCLAVLTLDWNAPTYTAAMLSASVPSGGFGAPSNWHVTEEDAMGGDLLWTVRGRPCWLADQQLHLGHSMASPFIAIESNSLEGCHAATQHGLDFFIRVDLAGRLWLGDWGHDVRGWGLEPTAAGFSVWLLNLPILSAQSWGRITSEQNGGYFGCGNDNHLGAQATSIELLRLTPPAPPAQPPPGPPPDVALSPLAIEATVPTRVSLGGRGVRDGDSVVFIPFGTIFRDDGSLGYQQLAADCEGAMSYALRGGHGGVVSGGGVELTLGRWGVYKMCVAAQASLNPQFTFVAGVQLAAHPPTASSGGGSGGAEHTAPPPPPSPPSSGGGSTACGPSTAINVANGRCEITCDGSSRRRQLDVELSPCQSSTRDALCSHASASPPAAAALVAATSGGGSANATLGLGIALAGVLVANAAWCVHARHRGREKPLIKRLARTSTVEMPLQTTMALGALPLSCSPSEPSAASATASGHSLGDMLLVGADQRR